MKLLAKERALLKTEAILRATSRVTSVEPLCCKNDRIAPSALSRTCNRNTQSATDLVALVAVSLFVGLGRAFLHKTRSCGRWGRTKLGPRDMRAEIRVHATSI